MAGNHQRIKRFFQNIDHGYEDRWIIYEQLERKHLRDGVIWVDAGCGGANGEISELGSAARYAVGLDMILPEHTTPAPFILGDVLHLPFKNNSIDLLTLRFVVEHLTEPLSALSEARQVLKKDGVLLFMTTNRLSPYILLPNLFPFSVKNLIIRSIFKVHATDILPTYHRMNTPRTVKRLLHEAGFSSPELRLVQEVNYTRKSIAAMSFLIHFLTGLFPWLKCLRSNIICTATK
jgi:SAM-dependent methyltransferase